MTFSSRNLVLTAILSAALGLSAYAADPLPASASLATAPAATAPTSQPDAGTVAVTVNGNTISSTEVGKESLRLEAQVAGQIPPSHMKELQAVIRQQAVANLVNKQLLLQAAVDSKIVVSDADMKAAIADITKDAPAGEDLKTLLAHAGISEAQFTQQMTDGLMIQKLLAAQTAALAVTDDDLGKYYAGHPDQFNRGETVSARHILVKFAAGDDDAKKTEKKKKIEDIRKRLLGGEDFAKVCQETSDDPGSKGNGGLYEDMERGQMVGPFDNAAFTQKVGEIGPVVETEFGYHVIKVEKHNPAGPIPLAQIKDRLKSYLEQQKKQDTVGNYVIKLRGAAQISYAEGYAPTTQPSTQPATEPTTKN